MRRWRFKKNMTKEEFDSFKLMTDIMVYLDVQDSLTQKSTNNPEALKFYIKHTHERIISSIENGDFND